MHTRTTFIVGPPSETLADAGRQFEDFVESARRDGEAIRQIAGLESRPAIVPNTRFLASPKDGLQLAGLVVFEYE